MASFPDLWVLLLYVFLLLLVFGFACRSQISPFSFELGLMSRTLVGVWFWVVDHLFIGPNLLLAFSRAMDYQPRLRILTLMFMSNGRSGYLIGMRRTLD